MNHIGFDKSEELDVSRRWSCVRHNPCSALLYVERYGPRFWVIIPLPALFMGLVLIGASYHIVTKSNLAGAEGVQLTGLTLYYGVFASYPCLAWVIPSEVYPTYLRNYGMTSSDVTLFLSAFLTTHDFSAMQGSTTLPGPTLGFYGSIAVIGCFYQIFFMSETKNKTLEKIDVIFRKPISQITRENIASTKNTTRKLFRF
jgi:hypothetical protein